MRQSMKFLCLIGFFVFLVTTAFPLHGEAGKPGATEVIKTFNATLLECMKRADELRYTGRYQLLEPVVKESFALSFMGAQSMGRYWKTLKEGERKLFLKVYTEWTIATYAGRFDDYSGEKFQVLKESEPDRGTVIVVSRLVQTSDENIDFYYKLRSFGGTWQVVDIQISGVSQLALTRSQFVDVMKSKGFDGLIALLKRKIEEFAHEKKQ